MAFRYNSAGQVIECSNCNGTGRAWDYTFTNIRPCHACGGKQQHWTAASCMTCGGKGELYDKNIVTCQSCHGTGRSGG
jgi:DnaJ-class molecular chaperone